MANDIDIAVATREMIQNMITATPTGLDELFNSQSNKTNNHIYIQHYDTTHYLFLTVSYTGLYYTGLIYSYVQWLYYIVISENTNVDHIL